MYKLSNESVAIPLGPLNIAAAPKPSENPTVPPASTVTVPVKVPLFMSPFVFSAKKMSELVREMVTLHAFPRPLNSVAVTPLRRRCKIRLLPRSAINKVPFEFSATPHGELSPETSVDTIPVGDTILSEPPESVTAIEPFKRLQLWKTH